MSDNHCLVIHCEQPTSLFSQIGNYRRYLNLHSQCFLLWLSQKYMKISFWYHFGHFDSKWRCQQMCRLQSNLHTEAYSKVTCTENIRQTVTSCHNDLWWLRDSNSIKKKKNFEYLLVFMGEWLKFKVNSETCSFSVVWFLDIVCVNASVLKPAWIFLIKGKQIRLEMKL